MDRIGFIGVGHLAGALVEGLIRSGLPPSGIQLSPRGRSPDLAERYGIAVAGSNADLVAACRTVVLAVRPPAAAGAVDGLPWTPDHLLVSACAGVRIGSLAGAQPATVVRAMPLTAAAFLASPTAIFPADDRALALFGRMGPVVPLDDEDQFDVATVSAAVYGWVHALIGRGIAWSVAHGLSEPVARRLVASTFVAAGRTAADTRESTGELMRALVTPGGITERGLDVLRDRGVAAAWDDACAAVLSKLEDMGRAPDERKPDRPV